MAADESYLRRNTTGRRNTTDNGSLRTEHADEHGADEDHQLSRLRAFVVISRVEFMPGGLFFIFASAALACLTWTDIGRNISLIVAGAIVWYLSHLIGSQINCLSDQQIDREHKLRLAQAVESLGPKSVSVAIGVEAVAAFGAAVGMAVATHRPVLPFVWLVGFVLAMAYSMEPVRLKRRVWLNPVSLLLVLYAFPMMYGYLALASSVRGAALSMIAGTALQMLALILLNPAEDIVTDRAGGIATPCTLHGLRVIAPLAAAAYLAGMFGTFWSVVNLAVGQGTLLYAGLALAGAVQLVILQELIRLAALSRTVDSHDKHRRTNRLVRRNPLHFALLGVSFAVASGLVVK